MKTFDDVYSALRKKNRKNYYLLIGCCFFSVLLITAYVSIMRSPTILNVLPEGGDSRKQVMMVFALAVVGCGTFTTYASGLFFRSKSRDTGVFLALGASKTMIQRELMKELALISFGSCATGALLATPLAWLIWQGFRMMIVDSEEMLLKFEPTAYLYALAFSAFVIVSVFLMGVRFVRRTNIIDIVHESQKTEPIREVKQWYGKVGILLIIVGGLLGYFVPTFCVLVLQWYPPEGLTTIFFIPSLLGMYMVLLHSVVNGWGGKKNHYKNIISSSMMKFQGRQTVRNMLVITVLLAGAYFATFYVPTISASVSSQNRPIDYAFHSRIDQDVPKESDIRAMADQHGVKITSWAQADISALAIDGEEEVETMGSVGTTYELVYRPMLSESYFISETGYQNLTGDSLDVQPGGIVPILNENGYTGSMQDVVNLVTNPVTRETLPVTVQETRNNIMLFSYYVLDDNDFATISDGLTDVWRESQTFFNVEDSKSSYPFANQLFNDIVDGSDASCEIGTYYDRVAKIRSEEAGTVYWGDTDSSTPTLYSERDSSAFRLYWKYMPVFSVLDSNDSIRTTAVFTMLFIFVAIICFAAVVVIGYTRCLTIALTNSQVYGDLRHLGASRKYLYNAVRGQVSRVWATPAITGTCIICAFYTLIMFANGDGGITSREFTSLAICFAIVMALSLILYGFYRLSLKKVCEVLHI